jgi:hypothetical protein
MSETKRMAEEAKRAGQEYQEHAKSMGQEYKRRQRAGSKRQIGRSAKSIEGSRPSLPR